MLRSHEDFGKRAHFYPAHPDGWEDFCAYLAKAFGKALETSDFSHIATYFFSLGYLLVGRGALLLSSGAGASAKDRPLPYRRTRKYLSFNRLGPPKVFPGQSSGAGLAGKFSTSGLSPKRENFSQRDFADLFALRAYPL